MKFPTIAKWVGPTENRTVNGMREYRGAVEHIASGSYDGTIAWQKNNTTGGNRTSSHFIIARDGRIAQMVDTADASWAQRGGNSTWLSIENEGRTPGDTGYKPGLERLTDAQVRANGVLLAALSKAHGFPLQLATSPTGRGIGHHSMGAENGFDWGHDSCPGEVIKSQKPAILAAALAAVKPQTGDDEVKTLVRFIDDPTGAVFLTDFITSKHVQSYEELRDYLNLADEGSLNLHRGQGPEWDANGVRLLGRRELNGVIVGNVPAGWESAA